MDHNYLSSLYSYGAELQISELNPATSIDMYSSDVASVSQETSPAEDEEGVLLPPPPVGPVPVSVRRLAKPASLKRERELPAHNTAALMVNEAPPPAKRACRGRRELP